MKKICILLLLLFVSLPVFSAPNFDPDLKPIIYDVSEFQDYCDKLEENYWKMVHEGKCSCSNGAYVRYVEMPIYKYIEEHPMQYPEH